MRIKILIGSSLISAIIIFTECNNHNTYKTVKIGDQTWMVENLNVTTYRNGDPIPEAKTTEEWQKAGKEGTPAWCYYDIDTANGAKYGTLYNWFAVIDSRGLAPKGWHVPSNDEWTILTDYLGGEALAGGKLKDADTSRWESPKLPANNSSGFTALPGGYRFDYGPFNTIGFYGIWWSATEYNSFSAWYRLVSSRRVGVSKSYYGKGYGYSVRCLKNN